MSGVVRLADLHATPEPTGPSVLVKMPCGREIDDPSKDTCGQGSVLALLCTTPDCSGDGDPVRSHLNPDGSLQQRSFDSEPFEFCGVEAGTYYVLPVIDHDDSRTLSNYDWTMGVKNLASSSVDYPARVQGYQIEVDGDVELSTTLTGTQASPVAVDFFNYRHPTPTWKAEEGWLFVVASLREDVSTTGQGIRILDLEAQQEVDQDGARAGVDAVPLADPDGALYEGTLTKLAFHEGVAYLGTDTPGVILTASLGANGTVQQGHSIDLREAGLDVADEVMNHAAVVTSGGHDWLVVTMRLSDGAPLPHNPNVPLLVVDLSGLEDGNVTSAVGLTVDTLAELDDVRLDGVMAADGVVYLVETGANSRARQDDGLNRLWALTLDADGAVDTLQVYDGDEFNAEGDVPECGSSPAYLEAGLWVGEFDGATHAFVGNLRTISVWRFAAADPTAGERVQHGSGLTAFDPRLDDYAVGYSVLRPSPDGSRLHVFGDCKSRYLSVVPEDWSGTSGVRTQSRRRVATLDLATPDADGLPSIYQGYGDATSAPDVVRTGLNDPDELLSEDVVAGIGMDCRAILWDIHQTYGYLNVAGNLFGSDCAANRVRDAVVTGEHIYVIGRGSESFETTGLGVSSEILLLDLAAGQEVLAPDWQWFYEGSAFEERYGYFGLTLGGRATLETSQGAFFVAK